MTIQPAVFFSLLLASLSLPSFSLTPPSEKFRAADWAVLHSSRSDQRHVSSRSHIRGKFACRTQFFQHGLDDAPGGNMPLVAPG